MRMSDVVLDHFRLVLPDLPERLTGSLVEDHIMVAIRRLTDKHPEEFANLILLSAMEAYGEARDRYERDARVQEDAYGDFFAELEDRGVDFDW